MLLRFNDYALLREWTVQGLIVVRTHLVLVSGKLVLVLHESGCIGNFLIGQIIMKAKGSQWQLPN